MNEETKKLPIPEGYEFDRVENGEVILKKKEVVLPRTFDECCINSVNSASVLDLNTLRDEKK